MNETAQQDRKLDAKLRWALRASPQFGAGCGYTQPLQVFGRQWSRMISKFSVSSERNCWAWESRSAKNRL
jgi:hypothetical protein